jgi:hypothetical protein
MRYVSKEGGFDYEYNIWEGFEERRKEKGVAAPRLAISNCEKEGMAHTARSLPA